MGEVFERLKINCLMIGMTHVQFWEATYGEIIDLLNAHNKNKKEELQQEASMNYQLANLIGVSVGRLMDKKAKMPSLEEAYPTLFEKKEEKTKEPPQQDWRIFKARMMQYAGAHNNKQKKKEVK